MSDDPIQYFRPLIDYGVLGLFALFVLYCVREWWKVMRPNYLARLEAETEKEQHQSRLFQALADNEPFRMEILRRQISLTEQIAANQQQHSRDCNTTHQLVQEIHERVYKG